MKDRNVNTGYLNTGEFNTGNSNTGYINTGNYNSGDLNIGNSNSGLRNIGNSNSGFRNIGNSNSGALNIGNSNTGNSNSGDSNSGDSNSGNYNTGAFNCGNYNTGCFNTNEPSVRLFNQDTGIECQEFYLSKYWRALVSAPFRLVYWRLFTEDEMKNSAEKQAVRGEHIEFTYKEACLNWWEKLTLENKEIIKSIPNFNNEIFEEITGIKLK